MPSPIITPGATVRLVQSKSKRRGVVTDCIRFMGELTRVGIVFRGERVPVWVSPSNVVVVKAAKRALK